MRANELRQWIIIPTLRLLGLYDDSTTKIAFANEAQVRLLSGTAAQESGIGERLRQQGYKDYEGGAFGIYQIEQTTHNQALNWLKLNKPQLLTKVLSLRSQSLGISPEEELIYNLYYATAIARCLYLSVNEPLPIAYDIEALAQYYKKYYNTENGAATAAQFVDNFHKYRC